MVDRVIPPQAWKSAFLVKLHEAIANSFLTAVQVTLDGSTTLWCISHSYQFCSTCKITEHSTPIRQIINADMEQYWTPHWQVS